MATSYTGVLTGDRIEWTGGVKPPDGPVRVEAASPPADPPPDERWLAAVAHLAAIAARGDLNAAEWEREREEIEGRDGDSRR